MHIFLRRDINETHPKLVTHIIDFDKPKEWQNKVQGNVLFSCLGTTLKQAGSKEKQRKVDYDYQYNFAKIAKENGVEQLVLISTMGANEKSFIHYSKMKGELEEAIKKLNFHRLVIFRPPSLIREKSNRKGEKLAVKVIQFFNSLGFFRKIKPMPTNFLAKRMQELSHQDKQGVFLLEG